MFDNLPEGNLSAPVFYARLGLFICPLITILYMIYLLDNYLNKYYSTYFQTSSTVAWSTIEHQLTWHISLILFSIACIILNLNLFFNPNFCNFGRQAHFMTHLITISILAAKFVNMLTIVNITVTLSVMIMWILFFAIFVIGQEKAHMLFARN